MPTDQSEVLVKSESVRTTMTADDFASMDTKIAARSSAVVSPTPLTPSESKKRAANFEPVRADPKRRSTGIMDISGSSAARVKSEKLMMMGSPYDTRKKSGKVELTFNESVPRDPRLGAEDASDAAFSREGCKVEIISGVGCEKKFMHTVPSERVAALEASLLNHAEAIRRHYALPLFSSIGKSNQDQIVVCGRIRPERFPGESSGGVSTDANVASDPKLSEKHGIFLEGSMEHSNGVIIKLDVSRVPRVSLFSGQIVVVQGTCSSGTTIIAKRIFSGIPPTKEKKVDTSVSATTMWAAAGPFTLPTDLEFLPLQDLLKQVKDAKPRPPDALILMGPFVPESHPKVANGNVVLDFDGEKYEASFSELFHLKLATLVSEFIVQTGCKTRVLLVPSIEDVHHTCVYPQPPFKSSLFESEDGSDLTHGGQVVCLPNPALVRIGSAVVGINTADLSVHLIRSGDVNRWSGAQRPHRFERFVDHVIGQRSFYPLYPAARGVPLDPAFYDDLKLTEKPDILLTRSNLSYFAKSSSDTVFVNPGMLARHSTGGTYAKFVVQPPKEDVSASTPSSSSTTETTAKTSPKEAVARRTRVDVVRI